MDEIDVSMLEPLLWQLVGLIGLQSTMAIVNAYGGTLLNIPRQADQNTALVTLIGIDKAGVLGRELGPDRLFIPKAERALRAVRNARLMADLRAKSVRQVAREYRLGERRIWQLKAEFGFVDQPSSPGLFD